VAEDLALLLISPPFWQAGTSLGSVIKPVVGGIKGHMCGGVGKSGRGDLDRLVANSRPPHLPFGPSGLL